MSVDTTTLDRLYLEWSHFTQAKTRKELKLELYIEQAIGHLELGEIELAKAVLVAAVRKPMGNPAVAGNTLSSEAEEKEKGGGNE